MACRRPRLQRATRLAAIGGGLPLSVWVALLGLGGAAACNEARHYRVLSFFFDGVPKPGESRTTGYRRDGRGVFTKPDSFVGPPSPGVAQYTHAPYREGRCDACHDNTTGQLASTPQEGLCTSCHDEVPGEFRYVHGPVAVRDCLFCHESHASTRPALLLASGTELCLRCHALEDISTGAHHASIEASDCATCHSGHGGSDRFFLRQDGT